MKIKKLRIQNYKSISDLTIEDFSNVNMIFGPNNSGKSNVLTFIDILFSPKIKSAVPEFDTSRFKGETPSLKGQPSPFWDGMIINRPFIFRNNDWKKPINFEILIELPSESLSFLQPDQLIAIKKLFLDESATFNLELFGQIVGLTPISSEIHLDKVNLNEKNIYIRNPEDFFSSIPKTDKSGVKSSGYEIFHSILNLINNSVLFLNNDRYFHPEREDKSIEELIPSNFTNWFHNLSLDTERYNDFVKIIGEIATFKPSGDADFLKGEQNSPINQELDFEFARKGDDILLMLTNVLKKRLPLENFGTGVQQILFILSKIAEAKPKIILIEEIELNLSPKYQYELIQHLIKFIEGDTKCTQLFFTTHTPILAYRTDFVMFNIQISDIGETHCRKLGVEKKEIRDFYPKEIIDFLLGNTPKAQE